MKKMSVLGAGLALSAMLVLAGCGSNNNSDSKDAQPVALSAIQEKYPPVVKNEGTPLDNQTLKVGLVNNQFKGILNPFFYTDGNDWDIMKNTMAGAFATDSQFKLILDNDETPLKIHIDTDKKVVNIKINPKFKWNDGSTVSTDDIIKTYEICANQEFINASQVSRYGADLEAITGIKDYNEGKAKTIKGLEKVSDSEMNIHFDKLTPSVYYGGNMIGDFVQAKSVAGVSMKDMIKSDAFRKNPPSYGPYYVTNVVPGQSVSFKANPYYLYGEPKVKTVEMQTIPAAQQVKDIETGGHDLYMGAQANAFDQIKDFKNISILTAPDLYFSYMGFNQGTWDDKTQTCKFNKDAKMSNVSLKKALAYAIDNDTLGKKYFSGLRFNAAGPICPSFTSFIDPKLKGYNYDPEKAKKLLDEAGYKDVDGDGYREDPNGKKLEIHLAMMAGSPVQEPIAKYYIQQWKSIGLKATLVDGRLLEFNDFYDRVQKNDPNIDVFMGAWGVGSDPNPRGLWGPHESFNMGRYVSNDLTAVLDKINSEEAFDAKKQAQFYREFEKVFFDEVPAVPLMNRVDFVPVNKRVKYYDISSSDKPHNFGWEMLELTADKPMANK